VPSSIACKNNIKKLKGFQYEVSLSKIFIRVSVIKMVSKLAAGLFHK
jgi:hypothetical protein